jgi:hypothetical protein
MINFFLYIYNLSLSYGFLRGKNHMPALCVYIEIKLQKLIKIRKRSIYLFKLKPPRQCGNILTFCLFKIKKNVERLRRGFGQAEAILVMNMRPL